jgi:hypothetical protein
MIVRTHTVTVPEAPARIEPGGGQVARSIDALDATNVEGLTCS